MNMRSSIGTFFILTALACGGDKPPAKQADKAEPAAKAEPTAAAEPTEQAELPPKVAAAAKLAQAIDANPESADQILEDNDMNREDLDALMFEIAVDPELSAAYQQARTG